MTHYNIQWDLVMMAPVLISLFLLADYFEQRKYRKTHPPKKTAKAKGTKSLRRVRRKSKSGFRNMKSHGQRMRERTRRLEEAALAESMGQTPAA